MLTLSRNDFGDFFSVILPAAFAVVWDGLVEQCFKAQIYCLRNVQNCSRPLLASVANDQGSICWAVWTGKSSKGKCKGGASSVRESTRCVGRQRQLISISSSSGGRRCYRLRVEWRPHGAGLVHAV